jgi:2-polyprenyl-6-hydroxyphenyl methylase/3-demethylubiquinone-9 3-methyltransferase
VTGRNFAEYVRKYQEVRGMEFWHDVHDWLGGYPYESIREADFEALMRSLGFSRVRSFRKAGFGAVAPGCDEFVYRRDSR